jgi:cysteinyl-tRNA synthetase
VLKHFDTIFAVLNDDDAIRLSELGLGSAEQGYSDAEVEALIEARQIARQQRDFTASDGIRQQLAEHGILVEDSKDGSVRWKRK